MIEAEFGLGDEFKPLEGLEVDDAVTGEAGVEEAGGGGVRCRVSILTYRLPRVKS